MTASKKTKTIARLAGKLGMARRRLKEAERRIVSLEAENAGLKEIFRRVKGLASFFCFAFLKPGIYSATFVAANGCQLVISEFEDTTPAPHGFDVFFRPLTVQQAEDYLVRRLS
jgi:hypothetical protein